MKIVTLIENLVFQAGLLAEHRLSFFIDTGDSEFVGVCHCTGAEKFTGIKEELPSNIFIMQHPILYGFRYYPTLKI